MIFGSFQYMLHFKNKNAKVVPKKGKDIDWNNQLKMWVF